MMSTIKMKDGADMKEVVNEELLNSFRQTKEAAA